MKKTKERVGKLRVARQYECRNAPTDAEDEEVDTEELDVERFPEGVEPAWVNAKKGLTLNLGNYESVRFDVSITLPCYREEVEAALDEAWRMVDHTVRKQVDSVGRRRKK